MIRSFWEVVGRWGGGDVRIVGEAKGLVGKRLIWLNY